MSVVVSNAYSAANAGDRLLVDLSTGMLVEAGHPPAGMTLVAADPRSFTIGYPVVAAPAAHSMGTGRKVAEAAESLVSGGSRRLERCFLDASLHVAVGGGYLRFARTDESLKTTVVHLSQLRLASGTTAPTILLPQSIGPLGRHRRQVLEVLRRLETIYVRDDRSADELAVLGNVSRVPDLAVMSVANSQRPLKEPTTGRVGVVLRALDWFPGYESRVRALVSVLGGRAVPLLQSDVGARNSDSHFYRRLGLRPVASLGRAVEHGLVDAVVSVRLHGAVQSVLAGVPAVHLSYERKGYSAFTDLGVPDYVHPADCFDPLLVADQALLLAGSRSEYGAMIASRRHGVLRHRAAVVARLREFAR